jgi:hypothetical protein
MYACLYLLSIHNDNCCSMYIINVVIDMNNDVLWDWDPGWLGWIELGDAGY